MYRSNKETGSCCAFGSSLSSSPDPIRAQLLDFPSLVRTASSIGLGESLPSSKTASLPATVWPFSFHTLIHSKQFFTGSLTA